MADRPPPDDDVPPDEPPPDEEKRGEERRSYRDEEQRARGRLDQFIPDIVRRTFYAGLGAVFTTEEGIRKIASEFQLPKDVANYLINSAQGTKDELFRIVA